MTKEEEFDIKKFYPLEVDQSIGIYGQACLARTEALIKAVGPTKEARARVLQQKIRDWFWYGSFMEDDPRYGNINFWDELPKYAFFYSVNNNNDKPEEHVFFSDSIDDLTARYFEFYDPDDIIDLDTGRKLKPIVIKTVTFEEGELYVSPPRNS